MSRTLQELVEATELRLGENASGYFDRETITVPALNEAERHFAKKTLSLKRRHTQALTAGTGEYAKPSGLLVIEKAQLEDENGNYVPLKLTDSDTLDAENLMWRSTTGVPLHVLRSERSGYYILYPVPSATVDGRTLRLYGASYPSAPMTFALIATAVPEIDEGYHDLLPAFAYARLKQREQDFAGAVAGGGAEYDHESTGAKTELELERNRKARLFSIGSMAHDQYVDDY